MKTIDNKKILGPSSRETAEAGADKSPKTEQKSSGLSKAIKTVKRKMTQMLSSSSG